MDERAIPARRVPKGILQSVRKFIRTEVDNETPLEVIQAMLEWMYPGKHFEWFIFLWKRYHPKGGAAIETR